MHLRAANYTAAAVYSKAEVSAAVGEDGRRLWPPAPLPIEATANNNNNQFTATAGRRSISGTQINASQQDNNNTNNNSIGRVKREVRSAGLNGGGSKRFLTLESLPIGNSSNNDSNGNGKGNSTTTTTTNHTAAANSGSGSGGSATLSGFGKHDKTKLMELTIINLVELSALACEEDRQELALARAREALEGFGSLKAMVMQARQQTSAAGSQQQQQAATTGPSLFELSLMVNSNLAAQLKNNGHLEEAAELYTQLCKLASGSGAAMAASVLGGGGGAGSSSGLLLASSSSSSAQQYEARLLLHRFGLNIGNVWLEMREFQRALKYYRLTLDRLSSTSGQRNLRIKLMNNISLALLTMEQQQQQQQLSSSDAIVSLNRLLSDNLSQREADGPGSATSGGGGGGAVSNMAAGGTAPTTATTATTTTANNSNGTNNKLISSVLNSNHHRFALNLFVCHYQRGELSAMMGAFKSLVKVDICHHYERVFQPVAVAAAAAAGRAKRLAGGNYSGAHDGQPTTTTTTMAAAATNEGRRSSSSSTQSSSMAAGSGGTAHAASATAAAAAAAATVELDGRPAPRGRVDGRAALEWAASMGQSSSSSSMGAVVSKHKHQLQRQQQGGNKWRGLPSGGGGGGNGSVSLGIDEDGAATNGNQYGQLTNGERGTDGEEEEDEDDDDDDGDEDDDGDHDVEVDRRPPTRQQQQQRRRRRRRQQQQQQRQKWSLAAERMRQVMSCIQEDRLERLIGRKQAQLTRSLIMGCNLMVDLDNRSNARSGHHQQEYRSSTPSPTSVFDFCLKLLNARSSYDDTYKGLASELRTNSVGGLLEQAKLDEAVRVLTSIELELELERPQSIAGQLKPVAATTTTGAANHQRAKWSPVGGSPVVASNSCLLHLLRRRAKRALATGKQALAMDPTSVDNWLNLANCHLQLNEPKTAERLYERALALNPDSWSANYNLVLVHRKLSRHYDELKSCAKQSLARDRQHFAALLERKMVLSALQLALIYQQSGKHQQAGAIFNDLITGGTAGSKQAPEVHLLASRLMDDWSATGKTPATNSSASLTILQQANREHPYHLPVIERLVALYISQFNYSAAKTLLVACIKLRPDQVKWHQMLAECQRRAADYDGAIATYRAAIDAFPQDMGCLKALAKLADELGLVDERAKCDKKLERALRRRRATASDADDDLHDSVLHSSNAQTVAII